MAKVDILFHCGCGYRTHDQVLAEAHCDSEYHDMSVHGTVKSETRQFKEQAKVQRADYPSRKPKAGTRAATSAKPEREEPPKNQMADKLAAIRARLQQQEK